MKNSEITTEMVYKTKSLIMLKLYREEELLTHALNWINDSLCLQEFLENYDLELTDFEYEYYGLYEESED